MKNRPPKLHELFQVAADWKGATRGHPFQRQRAGLQRQESCEVVALRRILALTRGRHRGQCVSQTERACGAAESTGDVSGK